MITASRAYYVRPRGHAAEEETALSQATRQVSLQAHPRAALAVVVGLSVLGCGCDLQPPTAPIPTRGSDKAVPLIRYRAYPKLFVPSLVVGSLAALPDRLVASTLGPSQAKLVEIDASGAVLPIPVDLGATDEAVCHLALSLGQHAGFPEGDLLVSVGAEIRRLRFEPLSLSPLATLPAGEGDVTGLCFDSGGGYMFAAIVLSSQGGVYRLAPNGSLQKFGDLGPGGQGTTVASARFGQHAGHVLVGFPASGDVRSLSPTGEVSRLTGWSGVSGVHTVPEMPREFASSGAALFVAVRHGDSGRLFRFTAADIAAFPGSTLLTSLHASGNGLVSLSSGFYTLQAWSRSMGAEVAAAFVQRPEITRIDIDVVPGGVDAFPWNSMDPVPVGMLSSPNFDPSITDVGTVLLGGAAPVPQGKGTLGSFVELNGDTTPDLVLYFRPADMQLLPGTATLVLEGSTFAAERLQGQALVHVLQP